MPKNYHVGAQINVLYAVKKERGVVIRGMHDHVRYRAVINPFHSSKLSYGFIYEVGIANKI